MLTDDADPSSEAWDLDTVAGGEEPTDEEDLGTAGLHLEDDPADVVAGIIPADALVETDDLEDDELPQLPPEPAF